MSDTIIANELDQRIADAVARQEQRDQEAARRTQLMREANRQQALAEIKGWVERAFNDETLATLPRIHYDADHHGDIYTWTGYAAFLVDECELRIQMGNYSLVLRDPSSKSQPIVELPDREADDMLFLGIAQWRKRHATQVEQARQSAGEQTQALEQALNSQPSTVRTIAESSYERIIELTLDKHHAVLASLSNAGVKLIELTRRTNVNDDEYWGEQASEPGLFTLTTDEMRTLVSAHTAWQTKRADDSAQKATAEDTDEVPF